MSELKSRRPSDSGGAALQYSFHQLMTIGSVSVLLCLTGVGQAGQDCTVSRESKDEYGEQQLDEP